MPSLPVDAFWCAYVVLPLAIAMARVLDVSIGTIGVILLGRGMRLVAPLPARGRFGMVGVRRLIPWRKGK